MTPGELFTDGPDHTLNPGRRSIVAVVENTGDRPIQVGSHYHFAETNAAMLRRPGFSVWSGPSVNSSPGVMTTPLLRNTAADSPRGSSPL